jgi:hypothetical protein
MEKSHPRLEQAFLDRLQTRGVSQHWWVVWNVWAMRIADDVALGAGRYS